MAEPGIKWRSPGEVWRAYEAKHGAFDFIPALLNSDEERAVYREELARIDHAMRSGGRDLV